MKNKIIQAIKSIDWANISPATYTRYILMIIAIINMLLNAFKINPIEVSENEVYQGVSNILTCVLFVINTWKNKRNMMPQRKPTRNIKARRQPVKHGLPATEPPLPALTGSSPQ